MNYREDPEFNSEDDDYLEDRDSILEGHHRHMADVEIASFEATGKVSAYACLGKTWADMGWPEP